MAATALPLVNDRYLAEFGLVLQASVPAISNLTMTQIAKYAPDGVARVLNSTDPKTKPLKELYAASFGVNTSATLLPELIETVDHGSRVLEQVLTFALTTPVVLFVVWLRVWARRMNSSKLWVSDWMIIFGFLSTVGYTAIMYEALAHAGAARHMWDITYAQFKYNLKLSYVCQIYYNLNIAPIKLALLAFYKTISPQRFYQIAINIVGAVLILSTIASTFPMIFLCSPINFWNNPLEMKCINKLALLEGQGTIVVITDFALFILPATVVMQLQMSKKEKAIVVLFFALGALGTIGSVMRMVSLVNYVESTDYTWIEGTTAIWTIIEAYIGIVCASIPALRVVFLHFFPNLLRSSAREGGSSRPTATIGSGKKPTWGRSGGGSSGVSAMDTVFDDGLGCGHVQLEEMGDEEKDGGKIRVSSARTRSQDSLQGRRTEEV